jgi:hypothetical protein
MNRDQWIVPCRDAAGRERTLCVIVRGSEVVILAPPGESAILDRTGAARFLSIVAMSAHVANTPAPGASGRAGQTATASTVEQYSDGVPPAVDGRPAPPSYRGGTATPIPVPPRSSTYLSARATRSSSA